MTFVLVVSALSVDAAFAAAYIVVCLPAFSPETVHRDAP
jgi:hypothetical protein